MDSNWRYITFKINQYLDEFDWVIKESAKKCFITDNIPTVINEEGKASQNFLEAMAYTAILSMIMLKL